MTKTKIKEMLCPDEKMLEAFLKKKRDYPDIAQHVNNCPHCQDAVLVQQWMGDFHRVTVKDMETEKSFPDAGSVWQNVQNRGAVDKKLLKKAMLPLLIPRILTYVLAVIGTFMFLTGKIGIFKDFFSDTLGLGKLSGSFLVILKNAFLSSPYVTLPMVIAVTGIIIYLLFSAFHPEEV